MKFLMLSILGLVFSISSAHACTDFSGFWSGICKESGQPTNSPNISYQQHGCTVLTEGINGYDIGFTRATVRRTDVSSYVQLVTLNWNGDSTKLNQSITIHRRNKTDHSRVDGSESGTIELLSPTQMQVTLVGDITVRTPGKPKQVIHSNVICDYHKQ